MMINWENRWENAYPNIILSDSVIDDLKIDNRNIVLDLKDIGFAIKCNGKYYRSKSAQVIFDNCDNENVIIKRIHRKKKINGAIINVMDEIEINDFFTNISSRKWKFEVVEEYYSTMGGLFIGKIRQRKCSEWCLVKMQFKSMVYYWDKIDYSYTVN